MQIPVLALSVFGSPETVGIFQRMHFLGLLLFQVSVSSVISAMLPEIAKYKDNPQLLAARFIDNLKIAAAAILTLIVLGWFSADGIISIMFGKRWLDGLPFLQILIVAGGFSSLCALPIIYSEACAQNKSRYLISAISVAVLIGAIIIGPEKTGEWVANSFLFSSFIMLVLSIVFVCIWLSINISSVVRCLLPAFSSAIVLFIGLHSLRHLSNAYSFNVINILFMNSVLACLIMCFFIRFVVPLPYRKKLADVSHSNGKKIYRYPLLLLGF